jgi:ribosome maturation factor RimP
MMGQEGWAYWMGKKAYIVLKNKKFYQGKIIDVDDSSPPLIWITIIDKFNNRVMFVHSEIELMQEEA